MVSTKYKLIDNIEISDNLHVNIYQVKKKNISKRDYDSIQKRYRETLNFVPIPDVLFWILVHNSKRNELVASVALERLDKKGISSMPLVFYRYPLNFETVEKALNDIDVKMNLSGEVGTLTIHSNDFQECLNIAAVLFYNSAKVLKEQMNCKTIISVTHIGVRKILDCLNVKYKYLPQEYSESISITDLTKRIESELSINEKDANSWIENYIYNKDCNTKTIAINIDNVINETKKFILTFLNIAI